MFLEELASTHTNLSNLWFCGPECLNPAKKTLDPSVGFNNSLIDVSIVFGFRRFVSKRGDDRKSEKMLQIVNLSKNPRLILRSKPKNFQNASKRLRIRKSWSNVLFLILSWSCPVVNNSFLNLDLHFRRWTTAMVKVRRATMFPNPKEKQKKHMLTYIGLIAIASA